MPSYLGADDPDHFLATAKSNATMPCHLHVNYENEDWQNEAQTAPQCAGRAIFLKNMAHSPYGNMRLVELVKAVSRDVAKVFQWPMEFLQWHNPKNLTENLAKLRDKG